MNPNEGQNPVITLLKKFFWTPVKVACQLGFFSLKREDMEKALPVLEKHRGSVSFLSLASMLFWTISPTNFQKTRDERYYLDQHIKGNAPPSCSVWAFR